jgi:hypothetical protein
MSSTEIPIVASTKSSIQIGSVKCGERVAVLQEADSGREKIHTASGTIGYITDSFLPKDSADSSNSNGPSASTDSAHRLAANTLRAVAWRGIPWVTTSYYQQSGSAYSNCTGSGTWFGNTLQANSSCTTQYTPAQTVPVNWTHYTIYNLVETSTSWLVIGCTRNYAFSKCSYLVPGSIFPFEYKKGRIAVTGQEAGKSKEQSLEFDVYSNRAK